MRMTLLGLEYKGITSIGLLSYVKISQLVKTVKVGRTDIYTHTDTNHGKLKTPFLSFHGRKMGLNPLSFIFNYLHPQELWTVMT
jgi:hypothetical protein